MQRCAFILVILLRLAGSVIAADQTTLHIHADQIVQPNHTTLSGVCIEDVNHEIYGGLYSQMIFGESFQEPPPTDTLPGFHNFGGSWVSRDHVVEIDGSDGPKLISDQARVVDGSISVEMQFANKTGENAGLIVRVNKPSTGADAFDGYEISLDPARQAVRLARHRHNFDLIADQHCEVPVGRFFPVKVVLQNSVIEIFVDGKSILRKEDQSPALPGGMVGLRTWHCKASFRNLSTDVADKPLTLSFETPASVGAISGMWRPVIQGNAVAHFGLDIAHPFTGSQSQIVTFDSGEGEAGIENRGLNRQGMCFFAGKSYDGYAWIRAEKVTTLVARLESGDGSKVFAKQTIEVRVGDWQRIEFSLTPDTGDRTGRFALVLQHPGSLAVGHVFLQPAAWGRFMDLPVRRDIVQGLIDQGVAVIRYGGSMVNSPEYHWKNMIGPPDHRPPYGGLWYPYSSNGWGVIDFLNLCEAMKVVGIPDLNVNESPQDLADFIEYVNGSPDSPWGERRARDGHPAPYHLKHLELGNEERVDAAYAAKFTAVATEIWKKDPGIILIVGDFAYSRKITDPDHITGADGKITNLDGQRKVLDCARQNNGEVWFDVHVWSEALRSSPTLIALPTYIDAINKLANGAKHHVVVFELNANSHGQNRALANAVSINTIRRDNRVPVVISANGLQPDGQNDNGWDQGLLFFNPAQVWLQPPGYITQMQSRNTLPRLLSCDVNSVLESHLDVTASCSEDGKSLVLQVVNTGPAETVTIDLQGFTSVKSTAHVTELASSTNAANTADRPSRVSPQESDWPHQIKAEKIEHVFPEHSFTVIRFE